MGKPFHFDRLTPLKPWDRRPTEGPKAFAAFCIYRDLGPNRTIDKAYEHCTGKRCKSGRASPNWFGWSARNEWPMRAKEWDEHLQSIANGQREDAMRDAASRLESQRKDFVNRETELAFKLGERLLEFVERTLFRRERVKQDDGTYTEQDITVEEMSYSNVAQLLRAFSSVGRIGLGMNAMDEDEPDPQRFREIFYTTRGQLAQRLPPGAMPEMPVNPNAKPALNLSAEQLADAGIEVKEAYRANGKSRKLRPESE